MLLSDNHNKTKILTLALFVGLGLGLSACQVRPLYSSTTASGQMLATELSSVEIAPADNRIEQEIRNKLIFAFTGGGLPEAPAYKLVLDTETRSDDLTIESGTGLAKTTRVSMTATYTLIKLSDKSMATKGSSYFTPNLPEAPSALPTIAPSLMPKIAQPNKLPMIFSCACLLSSLQARNFRSRPPLFAIGRPVSRLQNWQTPFFKGRQWRKSRPIWSIAIWSNPIMPIRSF